MAVRSQSIRQRFFPLLVVACLDLISVRTAEARSKGDELAAFDNERDNEKKDETFADLSKSIPTSVPSFSGWRRPQTTRKRDRWLFEA